MRSLAAAALWTLFSGGCAPAAPAARLGLKLPPAALGASISVQQHLTVERGGRVSELDTALEVDGEEVNLVGLALGQRVMTVRYDGRNITSWTHASFPQQVRGEDVLEDLQLTLWPIEAIRRALPSGWEIEENGRRRTLSLAGAPVTVIDYSGEPRWSGRVVLSNLRYRYRLIIESAS